MDLDKKVFEDNGIVTEVVSLEKGDFVLDLGLSLESNDLSLNFYHKNQQNYGNVFNHMAIMSEDNTDVYEAFINLIEQNTVPHNRDGRNDYNYPNATIHGDESFMHISNSSDNLVFLTFDISIVNRHSKTVFVGSENPQHESLIEFYNRCNEAYLAKIKKPAC